MPWGRAVNLGLLAPVADPSRTSCPHPTGRTDPSVRDGGQSNPVLSEVRTLSIRPREAGSVTARGASSAANASVPTNLATAQIAQLRPAKLRRVSIQGLACKKRYLVIAGGELRTCQ